MNESSSFDDPIQPHDVPGKPPWKIILIVSAVVLLLSCCGVGVLIYAVTFTIR